MSEPLVIVERDALGVGLVALNRPAARNALSRALVAELHAAADRLASDDGLRVVILTGAGDRAFCAGADLVERRAMTPEELTGTTVGILAAVDAIAALPVPVIGAINGFALAGGAELALACDVRLGTPDTTLGFPEVKLGIFPGAGGVARLPRLIGPSAAAELLYTGRQVHADEAYRLGLIDALAPTDELMLSARATAELIAENAPLAIRAVKQAMRASDGLPFVEAQAAIARHRRPLDATADYAEGLAAFAEKRTPQFTGN